jgi:hypothetical protein
MRFVSFFNAGGNGPRFGVIGATDGATCVLVPVCAVTISKSDSSRSLRMTFTLSNDNSPWIAGLPKRGITDCGSRRRTRFIRPNKFRVKSHSLAAPVGAITQARLPNATIAALARLARCIQVGWDNGGMICVRLCACAAEKGELALGSTVGGADVGDTVDAAGAGVGAVAAGASTADFAADWAKGFFAEPNLGRRLHSLTL